MSPRPPLIPSRSRDTNSRSRDSPNMSREQIIGESRSKIITSSLRNYINPKIKGIGTSPIQEIHRPIAIRSEPSGLASPLSSLSIGQRVTDQSEVSPPPRHLRNDTPLPPPPQNIPSNDHSTSSTALYSSNQVGASSIQAANQQEPPPQPTQRRLTARMTPPLPSITTINSSAQQNSASSTQQIGNFSLKYGATVKYNLVPRGHTGNIRLRYGSNPRRSPIQVSQNRISPYRLPPRSPNNPRTPEPLPEATVDTPEEDLRR